MQDVIETAPKEFDDVVIIEANKDVTPLLAGADEAFVAQSAQLMGDGGLGHSQAVHQFADANLSIQQGGNDEDACRIAQRVEQAGKVGGNFGSDGFLRHVLDPAADAGLIGAVGVAIFF